MKAPSVAWSAWYICGMRITRRRALQGLSATAAVAASGFPVGCLELEREVSPVGIELAKRRIDTLVVVMMENRSFDHCVGALSLVEGRSDVDGLKEGIVNRTLAGDIIVPAAADLGCIADPPHGWDSCHRQFNDGACDSFVTEYERTTGRDAPHHRCMDYLPRALQPTTFAMADHFALCQRWFSSVMGPTWPNRYHMLATTSHGEQGNNFLGRPVDSMFTRMLKAEVPYGVSYGNIPFEIVLEGMSVQDPEMNRHDAFFARAAAGTLRAVEVINPIYGQSDDHPPCHPLAGQIFLQSIYEAMRTSPQWERSLLVVTYDEHGGFHDHVPPPLVDDDYAAEGFDQLGFRVPTWVAGPFVKEQHVSDVQFDHTSIYATIAALHGLDPIGTRDENANTLLSLLDEDRMQATIHGQGRRCPPSSPTKPRSSPTSAGAFRFTAPKTSSAPSPARPNLKAPLRRDSPIKPRACAQTRWAPWPTFWPTLNNKACGNGAERSVLFVVGADAGADAADDVVDVALEDACGGDAGEDAVVVGEGAAVVDGAAGEAADDAAGGGDDGGGGGAVPDLDVS
jgi:phospholipase C